MSKILGISSYYHDSAAALLVDGEIIAAVQEERFTRIKHDRRFPIKSIKYCLDSNDYNLSEIDYVVFYEKPFVTFDRLLKTYLLNAPYGLNSFLHSMPVWLTKKLNLKREIKKELLSLEKTKENDIPKLLFNDHHRSHAASAFYPSPFTKGAILCLDAVGEWASTSVWTGDNHILSPKWEIRFPHSLGLLYSSFTYFSGFKVNSGEYKLMGLAPYGKPLYVQTILDNLIDLKEDGTFKLNMDFFSYTKDLKMTNDRFSDLFGGPPRNPESTLTQREMDLAASIQNVTEETLIRLGRTIYKETGMKKLCLAGGVALNCVANGRLLREGPFSDLWIQPAAGDAGGAIGAALTVWHEYLGYERIANPDDSMQGTYLGPQFSQQNIEDYLHKEKYPFITLEEDKLAKRVSELISQENIIGWFNGRMEFGPRALGNRSILGDPRSKNTQSVMNLKIKYRESFRPFAPVIKEERLSEWFELDQKSPYMLLVADIKKEKQVAMTKKQESFFGIDKLHVQRSDIPAVTHVDYSARVQTLNKNTNHLFWKLLDEFEKLTGCPILVNTSFNVRGEPIVCTPIDAYQCFMRTEMDYLVLGNCLLSKIEQPNKQKNKSWMREFELD